MLEIDRILELLAMDRTGHSIDELAKKTNLNIRETEEIVEFLAMHRFISLSGQGKKAKIDGRVNLFLKLIQGEEKLSAR